MTTIITKYVDASHYLKYILNIITILENNSSIIFIEIERFLGIMRGGRRLDMEFTVRRAKPEDALFLTSISLGTKRYGDYPKESLETWDDELAITEEYIEENIVLIAQKKDTIIGYCSVIEVGESYWRDEAFIKAGYWLDHLFIRPAYIRSGIGSRLIEELVGQCRENNIDKLYILSDPNTNGFYDKIGAIYIQDMPLGIEGSEVCLFELCILQEDVSKIENHTKESDRKQSKIEIEDLSKKRMRLEQEILGQKLYELDKDIDEDEEINVDFSEDESDDEEIDIYDNEDSEEAYYPQKYDREHPIVNFDFTTPIGYKFECEETEDTVYETSEELIDDIKEVSEKVEAYSIVEAEDLYDSSRESEEMLEGEYYIPWGDKIATDRRRARRILKEFNLLDSEDKKQTSSLLKELLGSTGDSIHIEPDFKCNYGYNIHIGENFYASYNCVILDDAKVTIGENCIISPQVGIYTLAYPINPERRMAGYEYALPVTIGNNVWIGGNAVIHPGVTIGNDVVIMPGSVITSDIPDGVIASGNPARIIKEIVK